MEVTHYGAWMEYGAFVVSAQRFSTDDESHQGTFGVAWGVASPDTPYPVDGEARWSGGMLAIDPVTEEVFAGNADATVSFSPERKDMTMSFTGIASIDTGLSRPDILYPSVSVNKKGFSSYTGEDRATSDHYITGRFFGPDRAEIGGGFGSDGLAGSFGGSRL